MQTQLYWIEGVRPGRLAITPRPRGGDWLEDEVQAWRRDGVTVAVSLLTADEVADLGLAAEYELCRANGIHFVTFPIPDRGLPGSRADFAKLVADLNGRLAAGEGVIVHCRQGIGRAAVVAVCVLACGGVGVEEAIRRVAVARGCPVPETPEQSRYLTEFAALPTATG